MQGVVKSYDPVTKDGVLMSDVDFAEFDLSSVALEGSIFRMLRQGSEWYSTSMTRDAQPIYVSVLKLIWAHLISCSNPANTYN